MVASSQRAYDITQVRLKLGTIDIVTVLNTEQTLFGAQDALAVARLARFTAIASLAQALGGGWTRPGVVVLPPSPANIPVPLEALAPGDEEAPAGMAPAGASPAAAKDRRS